MHRFPLSRSETLSDQCRSFAFGFGEILKSRSNAAAPVGHAGELKAHFNCAQRSRQHKVIEAAKMSDPKNSAGQMRESGSEGHVEGIQDNLSQLVGVMSFGHKRRCQRA